MLLNNPTNHWRKKKEIKIYIETNDNESMTTQNLWDSVKVVLQGKFIAKKANKQTKKKLP